MLSLGFRNFIWPTQLDKLDVMNFSVIKIEWELLFF